MIAEPAEQLLTIIQQREQEKAAAKKQAHKLAQLKPKEIYIGEKSVDNIVLSPDERYITYRLVTNPTTAKNSIVPNYVTSSGFTEDIPTRTKVGNPPAIYEMGLLDL